MTYVPANLFCEALILLYLTFNYLFILGEDEEALAEASTHDLVDLASILGFHSMMNQDQFHEYESGKWAQKAEQIGILI